MMCFYKARSGKVRQWETRTELGQDLFPLRGRSPPSTLVPPDAHDTTTEFLVAVGPAYLGIALRQRLALEKFLCQLDLWFQSPTNVASGASFLL